jgi:hypothetical protein
VKHRPVGVENQRREGQVKVEAIGGEVESLEVGDPDTDVGFCGVNEGGWGTNDLFVEGGAVLSGLSAEHDQERS